MDEPTGPIVTIATATAKIDELMESLRSDHSIVVVTHSMMEARRIADRVAYFHLGRLLGAEGRCPSWPAANSPRGIGPKKKARFR